MNFDANWADAAQQMQETFTAGLQRAMGGFGGAGPASGMGTATGFPPGGLPAINLNAAQLQQIQQRYLADAAALWNQGVQAGSAIPEALSAASDRRFSNQAWADSPVAKFAAANYLLNARTLMSLAEAVDGDAKTKARVRFAVEQAVAASAPSNFMAMNAEAIHKAIATQGQSIGKGIENMLHDMKQVFNAFTYALTLRVNRFLDGLGIHRHEVAGRCGGNGLLHRKAHPGFGFCITLNGLGQAHQGAGVEQIVGSGKFGDRAIRPGWT